MAAPLVLITGVTGYLASAVLSSVLSAGYRVRGTVRNEAKKTLVLNRPTVAPYRDNLEVVILEDVTVDGAFDTVLTDVDYVIHLASPTATGAITDYQKDIIQPALKGTTGILYSAKKFPSVRRIVIASSLGALIPYEYYHTNDFSKVFTEEDSYPVPPDQKFSNLLHAYFASKAVALQATKAFTRTEKPHFDIVNIMAAYFIGPAEDAKTFDDVHVVSNRLALRPILGQKGELLVGEFSVHPGDAVRAHVEALKPEIPAGDYVLSVPAKFDDAIEIVRRVFPGAVESGKLPLGGSQLSRPMKVDTSKLERVFGWRLRSYEEQVKDLVAQLLEVL